MTDKETRDREQQDEEELETPEFIDNRIDVKASTVVTLEHVLRTVSEHRNVEEESKKPFKFNLLTNFGVIEGAVVTGNPKEGKPKDQEFLTELFQRSMDIRNDHLQKTVDELEGDPTIVNNTGAILIEDATLTPFANPGHKIHMDHVYLFTDQITGITASL